MGPSVSVSYILGPPLSAHTVRETTTKLCMAIKLDVRQIFTRSNQLMLTRDLFAVANILVSISFNKFKRKIILFGNNSLD